MATIKVESLAFAFASNVDAVAYDAADHYKSIAKNGRKGVDLVARRLGGDRPMWLIEVKDFTNLHGAPGAKNMVGLAEQVEDKVRHTIEDLQRWPDTDKHFQRIARIRDTAARRVVLHMECPSIPNKLFKGVPSPAKIRQQMTSRLRKIDPSPLVLNLESTPNANVPWTVRRAS